MSRENVERSRGVYAEYARGDFSFFDQLVDDFELVTSAENPDAGTFHGEAARRWLRNWVQSFEDLTIEATEILDAGGDDVFVGLLQRGRPRGSTTTVGERWWQVLTFRDGEPVRLRTFRSRGDALEAVGLSE